LDQFAIRQNRLPRWRPVEDADVPDGDIVIATWWETAEWVARLSPSKGAKVYFVQGHETFVTRSIDRVRATYRLPLHKIAVSRWLVDLMRDMYGDSKVTLAPNSVDTAQFHAPPRGKQARPTVGLIYSTPATKAIEVGLRAIETVRRECPKLQVVAFGTVPQPPDFASRPGITYVRQPEQNRIRELYAMCDAWLLSSKSEGFGLPVLEAMACRCPVVSTRSGGPQDLIRDGVNGFLVDVDDSDGLAGRALDVLRMPDHRWRAMSEAAYGTATGYTWEDASDRFLEGLRTAIERRPELERVQPVG
jgi:glycosyltransferase involved in cell wall biosynthesis